MFNLYMDDIEHSNCGIESQCEEIACYTTKELAENHCEILSSLFRKKKFFISEYQELEIDPPILNLINIIKDWDNCWKKETTNV